MFAAHRIPNLAAAWVLVTLVAVVSSARADASSHKPGQVGRQQVLLTTVGQADLNAPQMSECHLLRRAISRRACRT